VTALQGELLDIIRRDRARRSRGERFGRAAGKFFGALLTGALVALTNGLFFMLGVGVMHDHWWPQIPTIGYWWAVLTVMLLRGVFSRTPASKDADR
jgi:hypothetical protein